MNKKVFAELTESIKEAGAIRQMAENLQMLGNAALMERPKVAFLSSRRVAPAAVMRCYDWATGMRGCGSAGRLAPADGGGTPSLPCVVGGFQSALERDVFKLLLPDGGPPIVMVLARGMWRSVPVEYREAINAGRMLVVSPFSQGVVRVSKRRRRSAMAGFSRTATRRSSRLSIQTVRSRVSSPPARISATKSCEGNSF